MQTIPTQNQGSFFSLTNTMGMRYQLHTPEAVFTCPRRGATTVFRPYSPRPYFILVRMNVQPSNIEYCTLLELPARPSLSEVGTTDERVFYRVAQMVERSSSIAIKIGGALNCRDEILEPSA